MLEKIQAETDTGFTGIHKYHKNSLLPKKNSKKRPLTKDDKLVNYIISSERVTNEHAIGRVTAFTFGVKCAKIDI
jgi:hypothetical protein